MKYKAILFDLDDTLLDSMAARVKAFERALASAGITHLKAEQFLRDIQGVALGTALPRLAADLGLTIDLFEVFRSFYWSREKGLLELYPGVRDMLQELREREMRLGLVTSKEMNFKVNGRDAGAITELAELGISDLFSVKVGLEDVVQRKPHPEAVNLALSRLELSPAEAVMVGDSASDIKAAQSAGCHACYATWGIPADERGNLLDSVAPDFIIDSPEDLLRIVK